MNPSYAQLVLLPSERRVLRKMRRNSHMPETMIPNCHDLYVKGVICPNYTGEVDRIGSPIPDGTYRLDDGYWRYIEANRWFTLEYVLRSLIVPIAVGVASAVITKSLI